MKEEKNIDEIWKRLGELKEMQEIEEKMQKTNDTQPEVAHPKMNEK